MRSSRRIGAGFGLTVMLLVQAGCGHDEPAPPTRSLEVCVAPGDDRAAVEFRRSGAVIASGSISAGGSFAAPVPAGDTVETYVDGKLQATVEPGRADVKLGCPDN